MVGFSYALMGQAPALCVLALRQAQGERGHVKVLIKHPFALSLSKGSFFVAF